MLPALNAVPLRASLSPDPRLSALLSTQSNLDIEDRPELGPLVHWRGNNALPIHRWYKYREGYSPELIDTLNLGNRILDPFAGSGSIMVGAAQSGRESVGIDVSPLATFIAKVKVTALSNGQIKSAEKFLERSSDLTKNQQWPVPALKIAHKLFEPQILDTLQRVRTGLESWTDDSAVRDFLLLAWVSILESVGSYFKEGNGIKYRNKKRGASGYSLRTEGVWQLARFGADQEAFTLNAFTRQLGQMIEDANLVWGKQSSWKPQSIYTGSAAARMPELKTESFDSVVFSPP